jgi:hypothetical protein
MVEAFPEHLDLNDAAELALPESLNDGVLVVGVHVGMDFGGAIPALGVIVRLEVCGHAVEVIPAPQLQPHRSLIAQVHSWTDASPSGSSADGRSRRGGLRYVRGLAGRARGPSSAAQ